ncbi:glycosyltransferase [Rheinheimera pacifica]|uniref:glycosyltransferase n=1 Tax=Rheinheimera pacifica TaxID=173990 RepID=UPI002EDB6425
MISISVCLALYNGSSFILEQVESILNDLPSNSELIILNDCSSDGSVLLLDSISDERVRVLNNENNIGVNRTFEHLLCVAKGDYIFLSDQDDVWVSGRCQRMIDMLEQHNVLLVSTAFSFIDENSNPIDIPFDFLEEKSSTLNFDNMVRIFLGRANYYGCAMLIKRDLLRICLPFPKCIESHDLWIAIVANILKRNYHSSYISLGRRIHGNNLSIVERSFFSKIFSRLIFVFHIIIGYKRLFVFGVFK